MSTSPSLWFDGPPQRDRQGTPCIGTVRIAVADDDPDLLEVVAATLRSDAVQVYAASSGAELVRVLTDQGPVDLVVTDVNMPWMDGLSFIEATRRAHLNMPFVVMTGGHTPGLDDALARLGRARLLRKPFGANELRDAVTALLDREG